MKMLLWEKISNKKETYRNGDKDWFIVKKNDWMNKWLSDWLIDSMNVWFINSLIDTRLLFKWKCTSSNYIFLEE